MSFTSISIREALQLPEDSKTRIRGWVYRRRIYGDKAFVVVRDSTGIMQTVAAKGSTADFEDAENITIESAVEVEGIVKKDPRAPGGKELKVTSFKIISKAEPFPITASASREFLLDIRHLWVRSRKMTAIFKVRNTVFRAIHDYFKNKGYYEVQCPMFITAAVEGGATLFEVDYFGERKVYLTQSSQFYLEALIYSLEKVYTVAPSFRAEKSRTRRHLTEFWHAEAEAAWAGLNDIMKVEEELITYIVEKVLEENRQELDFLKRDISALERVKPPFPRISYTEAIEMLKRKGIKVEWGEDLGADEERALTQEFEKPFF
ncbi:MAG TPA: asparagine--tRNA ligase, partial [Thermofilum sp.]|nr:asparagine--tRNA ligase [Thermofilum sp.]